MASSVSDRLARWYGPTPFAAGTDARLCDRDPAHEQSAQIDVPSPTGRRISFHRFRPPQHLRASDARGRSSAAGVVDICSSLSSCREIGWATRRTAPGSTDGHREQQAPRNAVSVTGPAGVEATPSGLRRVPPPSRPGSTMSACAQGCRTRSLRSQRGALRRTYVHGWTLGSRPTDRVSFGFGDKPPVKQRPWSRLHRHCGSRLHRTTPNSSHFMPSGWPGVARA